MKEELVRRGGGMSLGQWMGACRRPRGDGRRMEPAASSWSNRPISSILLR
ncbi:hypothetical protein [Paenibacillus dendritiformis]|nr:hypothetical protein [Paenibacillus dendritiformis]